MKHLIIYCLIAISLLFNSELVMGQNVSSNQEPKNEQTSALTTENILPSGIKEVDIAKDMEEIIAKSKEKDAGLAVSLFKGERTILESYSGLGNKENDLKIDKNSVFEWGSITKLLVWVSIMQLNEEGKLDLEQDIRTILPSDFFKRLKYDEPITFLDLMNHSAGWQDVIVGLFVIPENVTNLEDALKEMEPPQIERPGAVSSYSNWGAALGGLIVEKISGKPFHQYVHEHIFEPLEMRHTALLPFSSDNPWVKEQREKMAGYDAEGKLMDIPDLGVTLYPAGQATGTLEDITRFAQALSSKTESKKLFNNPITLEKFCQPTLLFKEYGLPMNSHGMWAMNYKVPTLGHPGGTVKFFSSFSFNPESGYGCVILSNNKEAFSHIVDIPESVFGVTNSYSPKNTFGSNDYKEIEGFYVDARMVYKQGFMKLMRVLSLAKIVEHKKDKFKIISPFGEGRIEKNAAGIFEYIIITPMFIVEIPQMFTMEKIHDGRDIMHRYYGDSIKQSGKDVMFDILMLSLFIVAFLYAIAFIFIRLVGIVFRWINKLLKKDIKPINSHIRKGRKLNSIASFLIIATWLNTGILFSRTFSFTASRDSLHFNMIINVVLAILLFAFGVFMFYAFRKKNDEEKALKIRFLKHIDFYLMMFFSLAVAVNIIYWELWRF